MADIKETLNNLIKDSSKEGLEIKNKIDEILTKMKTGTLSELQNVAESILDVYADFALGKIDEDMVQVQVEAHKANVEGILADAETKAKIEFQGLVNDIQTFCVNKLVEYLKSQIKK